MSASRLGHLTVAQLEAAEDYLGVTLDDVARASKLRLTVLAAWATMLKDQPTSTIADVQALTFDELQQLAGVDPGGLGEA